MPKAGKVGTTHQCCTRISRVKPSAGGPGHVFLKREIYIWILLGQFLFQVTIATHNDRPQTTNLCVLNIACQI